MSEKHKNHNQDFLAPNDTLIKILKSAKNRRIRLSFNIATQTYKLSAPLYATPFEIQSFLKRNKAWIEKQLLRPKPSIPNFNVISGEKISLFGKEYALICTVDIKKSVLIKDQTIEITGLKNQHSKILLQGLKDLILKILTQRCFVLAQKVGKTINKVTIKETRTRWGSCSTKGNLNFSWRLIFAPNKVIDYICAHEVAHLVEMNHSDRFWKVVEDLEPCFKTSREWLKKNGKTLLYITFEEE